MKDLKVDMKWTQYHHCGLRVPASLVDYVGERVIVFDKNLDFTQHDVLVVEGDKATLGPARPWPNYTP